MITVYLIHIDPPYRHFRHYAGATSRQVDIRPGGMSAMKAWLYHHFKEYWGTHATQANDKLMEIEWPTEKPAAFITIDDRAILFDGTWPVIENLLQFKPWNKR